MVTRAIPAEERDAANLYMAARGRIDFWNVPPARAGVLARLGWAESRGGSLRLTAAGEAVARRLLAEPAPAT